MSSKADVVVVGGGVVGVSAAFHLAKAGAGNVLLLERRFLGAGASGKSGAVVRMHYSNPYDASLAQQSLPYFQHWDDYVGHGDSGYVKLGMARLITAGQEEPLRANVEMLRGCGVNTWVMTPAELADRYPHANLDGVPLVCWEEEAGYADPNGTVHGLADAARALGVEIRLNTPALRIRTESGRVTGVETPDGIIETSAVVVAAGAYANELINPLEIDYGLRPNRVQVAIFRRPFAHREPHPIFIDGKNAMWIRPEGPHSTLAGYDYDLFGANPDFYNESIDWEFLVECRNRLADRLPFMRETPMRGGWAGVITNSPDGHAVIEQTPGYDGLFLSLGDSGTNFKTAPMIGKCLAEWVVDGAPKSVDVTVFRGSRFADGTPIPGGVAYGSGPTSVFH